VATDQSAEPVAAHFPSEPRRKTRLRKWTIGLISGTALIVVVAGAAFWYFVGLGDPGHHLLNSLKTQELAALPSDALVTKVVPTDSHWDSHGCGGSYGWTSPGVVVQFRSREQGVDLVAHANRVLSAAGWTHGTVSGASYQIWTKTPNGSTSLAINRIPRGSVWAWEVSANTAPSGKAAQEC
jgi:hypothetical protein